VISARRSRAYGERLQSNVECGLRDLRIALILDYSAHCSRPRILAQKGKILRSSVTGTLTRTPVATPGRKVGEKEQSWHR
jgi:hypothetical protein